MTDLPKDQSSTPEIENLSPTIHQSKSVYQKMFELIQKSPMGAITSICALFITIILSLTVTFLFTNKNSC